MYAKTHSTVCELVLLLHLPFKQVNKCRENIAVVGFLFLPFFNFFWYLGSFKVVIEPNKPQILFTISVSVDFSCCQSNLGWFWYAHGTWRVSCVHYSDEIGLFKLWYGLIEKKFVNINWILVISIGFWSYQLDFGHIN